MLLFREKKTNRMEIYGSVKIMYDFEADIIKIKKNTMYQSVNLDEKNYEDANCQIFKKNVIRSKVINSNKKVTKKNKVKKYTI